MKIEHLDRLPDDVRVKVEGILIRKQSRCLNCNDLVEDREDLIAILNDTLGWVKRLKDKWVVCETCATLTQVKFLMSTVKGSGCVHCVDRDYINLNDSEIIRELERAREEADDEK